jgi:hypothetical protein
MEGHVMEVEASFMSHDWKDDLPFKDNLLAMMRQARGGGHMGWLLDNENDQFLAACGAALLKCSEEDRAWLKSQLDALRKFAAFATASREGIPVDIKGFAEAMEDVPHIDREYTLRDLWMSTKGGVR